jgi:hypothetical protein
MDENNEFPEQLEDEDFEKEKAEKKRLKKKVKEVNAQDDLDSSISDDESGILDEDAKNKKSKKSKKYISIIAIIILVIAVIAGVVYYIKGGKQTISENKPESALDNFCAYFNSADIKNILNYIDFKGYYIFNTELEAEDYPNFDSVYENFDETDETYQSYLEFLEECEATDESVYNTAMQEVKIALSKIQSVTKIQDTKNLYLVKADVVISVENQEDTTYTESIYVAKIDGQYKMVYGYFPDIIYSLFYYYGE